MSDNRTREECLRDIEDAKTRLRQLIANDPWVYGIKRTWNGGTRYHTCVEGKGWRQLIATDLTHSSLWLTSSLVRAEETVEAMSTDHMRTPGLSGAEYGVVRILKEALPHMSCWERYKHLKTFGGTP